jgi:hypothetical protein
MSSRHGVVSSFALSASNLDLDAADGPHCDDSNVRGAVRRARASAIAYHKIRVTTTAVTTPHDATANRTRTMSRSNGCSLPPRRSMYPPNVDPSPSDLAQRYLTGKATQGFTGSSQCHIRGRPKPFEFVEPDVRPFARPRPVQETLADGDQHGRARPQEAQLAAGARSIGQVANAIGPTSSRRRWSQPGWTFVGNGSVTASPA